MTRLFRVLSVFILCTLVAAIALPVHPSYAQDKPKGEITVWLFKGGAATKELFDGFAKAYPDIKATAVEMAPTDLYTKLPVAITSGTGAPDVSQVESGYMQQFIDQGGLADLTKYAASLSAKFNKSKLAIASADGKLYGLPTDIGPVVLFYRRDVFKAAGLSDDPDKVSDLVATWDDFLKTCKTILEKAKASCFPQNKANNYGDLYENMLWQQGLGWVDKDGKLTIDAAANVATLEKLGEFWKAGVVTDQLDWTDGWYADFASLDKPVASVIVGGWMGGFLKGWMAPKTEGRWGVVRMPAFKAGQPRSANQGGSNFVIPDQSKNKDAAWAFIQYSNANDATVLMGLEKADLFPALESVYSDKLFDAADPFFANQKVRKLYADVAKDIPAATLQTTAAFPALHRLVASAVQKYATGQLSAADALKEAADTARQQQLGK